MDALIGSKGIDQGAERDGGGRAKLFVWQRWTPVGLAAGGVSHSDPGLLVPLMLLAGMTPRNRSDHPSECCSPALCPLIIYVFFEAVKK